MSTVLAAGCIELQPANTIRSAAALGMAILFMVKSTRLRRIEGQAGGLIRMVGAGNYCIDILQQVQAVQGALAQASKQLLQSHMKTCVAHAFDSKKAADRDGVIAEVVDLFAKSSRTGK